MSKKQTATFAYFPGTGPGGARCGECRFFKKKTGNFAEGKEKYFCDKARQFINVTYETQPIPRDTQACKYFEAIPQKEQAA